VKALDLTASVHSMLGWSRVAELTIAVILYTKDTMWTTGSSRFMSVPGRSTDRMVSCPKEMGFTMAWAMYQSMENDNVYITTEGLTSKVYPMGPAVSDRHP
jgi:hypothetical protein